MNRRAFAGRGLVPVYVGDVHLQSSLSRLNAVQMSTLSTLAQMSDVHSYAIDRAAHALAEAEALQLCAGRSVDDADFQQATRAYLSQLALLTQEAGFELLLRLYEVRNQP